MGNDFNYSSSDGNFYVGDTGWHSDWRWSQQRGTTNRKYLTIKLAFYLDKVSRETGCLRVVPGSHFVGDIFSDDAQDTITQFSSDSVLDVPGSMVPAFALESRPGDMILFNHAIKHSSWGGGTRRRMFTINLEQRYAKEDLHLLRGRMGSMTRFWIDTAYGDLMVKTASPNRMRHLEQRLANQSHLPGLAQKARSEMSEPARE